MTATLSRDTLSGPSLTFSLDATTSTSSSSSKARKGKLEFVYSDKVKDGSTRPARTIATPAMIAYTKKGAIPHLTRDNVARLPNEMVHLSLEHFLDITPPVISQAPMSLHRFIGLHDTRSFQQPIITMALRDSSNLKLVASNQDNLVMASSSRGVAKISPEKVNDYLLARPADIVIALSDDTRGDLSYKRLEKVVKRGLRWTSNLLDKAQNRTNVFVPLVGGQSTAARAEFSEALLGVTETRATQPARREDGQSPLDSNISGYVLSIDPSLSTSQRDLCLASLDPLPTEKPRLALGVNGPHQILRTVQDVGLDLFLDEWSSHLSTIGAALDFCFPVPDELPLTSPSPAIEGGQVPIGHDLFNDSFERAFIPLSRSSLALTESEPNAFGPIPPTRAYVHHLLQAREMTSYVILAQHNLVVMHRFFASIRDVLASGQAEFEKEVERFLEVYEDQVIDDPRGRGYGFVLEATKEFDRVNKERGKGSLREKLAKGAGASGASTPMITSEVA